MGSRLYGKNMDAGNALRRRGRQNLDTMAARYFDGACEGHLIPAHHADSVRPIEADAFRDAGHEGPDVVYRRADGKIGGIDPALGAN